MQSGVDKYYDIDSQRQFRDDKEYNNIIFYEIIKYFNIIKNYIYTKNTPLLLSFLKCVTMCRLKCF